MQKGNEFSHFCKVLEHFRLITTNHYVIVLIFAFVSIYKKRDLHLIVRKIVIFFSKNGFSVEKLYASLRKMKTAKR